MDMGRVRRGELIAAVGGLLLLIALFFVNWYSAGADISTPIGTVSVHGDFGAWDSQGFFGTIANLVILAAAVAAVVLAILTATSRTVALPVAASALTAGLGIGAVVMVLLRMLFQPGPNDLIDLKLGILLALIGALIVAYGGWESMKEEGTTFDQARDQLQARYVRRPAPSPGGSAAPPRTEPPAPAAPAPEPTRSTPDWLAETPEPGPPEGPPERSTERPPEPPGDTAGEGEGPPPGGPPQTA